MKQNVVLRGRDVYSQIVKIDENPLMDKNSVPYKRYSYQAIAFILREPAYKAFDEGEMAELTLVPTEREVVDTTAPDKLHMVMREGWTYGGHLTSDQDYKLEMHSARKTALYRVPAERVHNDPSLSVAGTYKSNASVPAMGYPTVRQQDSAEQKAAMTSDSSNLDAELLAEAEKRDQQAAGQNKSA